MKIDRKQLQHDRYKYQKTTLVENPTQVGNSTKVSESTYPDSAANTCKTFPIHAQNVAEHVSSVALEAGANEGLERGYTRIPNSILMRLVSGDFTRSEIKIALVVARLTISYRRDMAPLSKHVLERLTGLRGPAILEAISGLVVKGMLQKQQGDYHKPNMLGLILPKGWDESEKVSCTNEKTGNTPEISADTQAMTANVLMHPLVEKPANPLVANSTQAMVEKATPFKDIQTYQNKNSLQDLSGPLKKYFQELKPRKKRESEWKAFEELRQDYQLADITDCLALLMAQGISRRGCEMQTCHSPMAYLAKAIDQVLKAVERTRSVKFSGRLDVQREIQLDEQRLEFERVQAEEWQQKQAAFEKAYPEVVDRELKIEELCQNTICTTPHARRIYAITKWWEINQTQLILANASSN